MHQNSYPKETENLSTDEMIINIHKTIKSMQEDWLSQSNVNVRHDIIKIRLDLMQIKTSIIDHINDLNNKPFDHIPELNRINTKIRDMEEKINAVITYLDISTNLENKSKRYDERQQNKFINPPD